VAEALDALREGVGGFGVHLEDVHSQT
jgi:hypothetical protein